MIPDNLIINADDFGLDVQISKGILSCIQRGLINSVSVVPSVDERQLDILDTIVCDYPNIKIGCHLSFVEIKPLFCGAHAKYSSVDSRLVWKMILSGKLLRKDIIHAWKAQIAWVRNRCNKVDHLDSHQHIHMLPGLWHTVRKLRTEFQISRLRVPYESLLTPIKKHSLSGFLFQCLALVRFRRMEHREFFGYFTSTRFNFEYYKPVFEFVMMHPDIQFELMVHPGWVPENKSRFSAWNAQWEQEITELEKLQSFFTSSAAQIR